MYVGGVGMCLCVCVGIYVYGWVGMYMSMQVSVAAGTRGGCMLPDVVQGTELGSSRTMSTLNHENHLSSP